MVDPAAAQAYREASEQDRMRMDVLLSLRICDFAKPPRPLEEIMHEISEQARARGLTPEILESLLQENNDED